MKDTASKRVIIMSDLESPYFEQTIFVLRENVVREEDVVLNEARQVVDRYMKRLERGSALMKPQARQHWKNASVLIGGAFLGAVATYCAAFM